MNETMKAVVRASKWRKSRPQGPVHSLVVGAMHWTVAEREAWLHGRSRRLEILGRIQDWSVTSL